MSLPQTYQQAVFKEADAPLTIEDVKLTPPGKGEVLVKVEACGVCFSDMFAQKNIMGGGLYVFSPAYFLYSGYWSRQFFDHRLLRESVARIHKLEMGRANAFFANLVPLSLAMKSLGTSLLSVTTRQRGRLVIELVGHGMEVTTVSFHYHQRSMRKPSRHD